MPTPSVESQVPHDAEILSVSELNAETKALLEEHFRSAWVTGEISNFHHHRSSGHMYFSLKDDRSEVRCAMFRGQNRGLGFQPGDGDQVIARGRVTIYEVRGSYQLVVDHMEPAGEGLLLRRLEELKAKLRADGLFDESHKQPLPGVPTRIGIVTSPTGAAVRDILHVLARRFPAVPVVIYPVQVQGDRARHEIAAALATAAERAECDVLIVGRGGGSLEDLWAFNEEHVARAIFACPIPVISAVGHEVDFTIADFVADQRAPTPSAAAEIVVPDAEHWLGSLRAADRRLAAGVRRAIQTRRGLLAQLIGRIGRRHPGLILQQHAQRLDELTRRAGKSLQQRLEIEHLGFAGTLTRLRNAAPMVRIERGREQLEQIRLRLAATMRGRIAEEHVKLASLAAGLDGVSPLGTLERGYAIIEDAKTGNVIRDADALHEKQRITGQLARGSFDAIVEKTRVEKTRVKKNEK